MRGRRQDGSGFGGYLGREIRLGSSRVFGLGVLMVEVLYSRLIDERARDLCVECGKEVDNRPES